MASSEQAKTRAHGRKKDPKDPKGPWLGQTVLEDLGRGDLQGAMRRDLEDVYQFYLDAEDRERLDEMSPLSRWGHLVFWVLKCSFLKLSPPRRLLLVGALLFFLQGLFDNLNPVTLVLSFVILLLTLLLELKDKLLAQDELAAGRTVQFALMPQEHLEQSGWEAWLFTRPANDVGGDLVDALEQPDGTLGFALGDVAGKGLGAALYMAKLQATLRALAPDAEDLAALGSHLNRIFCHDGLPERFASLVYLEATPHEGQVRVLNAGHHPPLVVGPKGYRVLAKGAPALGLTPKACFAEQQTVLTPGELLLVYSDGLVEARNEEGVFFEEDRLRALLPSLRGRTAQEAGRRLLGVVDRFVGEARPSDDLSLIVLRRLDTAAEPSLLPAVENRAAV